MDKYREITEAANLAKELVIGALHQEGHLNGNIDPESLCAEYVIHVQHKGIFGTIWDKIWGTPDGDRFALVITKQVHHFIPPKKSIGSTKNKQPLANRKKAVEATKKKLENE